jgi:adenylate kinase
LVDVAFDVIVKRLSSRRTCKACGYTAGPDTDACPRCGGEMYQRDDDKPETIQKRLDTYQNQTAPLIDYYSAQGKLIKVDGDRPVDEVYVDVKKELGL